MTKLKSENNFKMHFRYSLMPRPMLMPLFNLQYLFKSPIAKQSHWRLKLQHMNLAWGTKHSILTMEFKYSSITVFCSKLSFNYENIKKHMTTNSGNVPHYYDLISFKGFSSIILQREKCVSSLLFFCFYLNTVVSKKQNMLDMVSIQNFSI